MIEALRGLGYSAATALADIVDNSIAAEASTVDLVFRWSGPTSTVSILDDGRGMDEHELDVAMRLGELNPLAARTPSDLGRFGLGLKTASFSQARRLTVASRRSGPTSVLRWDLDVLASNPNQEWLLLEGAHPGSERLIEHLEARPTGTVVIWEALDRMVTPGSTEQDFLDLIDQVERHLALVFHRYLEGARPRLRLNINGRPVAPWDPFLAGHPATWRSPPAEFVGPSGIVTALGYVLPHKDRLTEAEYNEGAGQEGWTAQQGFYVYRNERLLLAGGWLGLGRPRSWTKEEPFRLARIRLDLPNTADAEWKIDIRKSRARPPAPVRDQLTKFGADIRSRARRVFAHRGQIGPQPGRGLLVQAWRAEHFHGGVRYRIDTEHPAIRGVLEEAGTLGPQLRAMLRVIEETLPVQRIWLDTAEAKETPRTGFAAEPDEAVRTVLVVLYRNLVRRKGVSPADARAQLARTDPFHQYPALVAALPDNPDPNGGS